MMKNFYLNDLASNGVEFSEVSKKDDNDPTGKCMVFVTPDADRTMNTFLGVSSKFSSNDCDFEKISVSDYLYVEGYLVTSDDALKAVDKAMSLAKNQNKKIALTLSDPGIVGFFKEKFLNILSNKVDLLFCNEEEAMSLTDTSNLDEAFEKLKSFASTFAITTGKEGSVVFDGSQKIKVSGFPVKAIDTNGAGDMYAGAFFYGLSLNKSYEESARIANYFSSKIVTKYGPRIEKNEMKRLLEEYKG